MSPWRLAVVLALLGAACERPAASTAPASSPLSAGTDDAGDPAVVAIVDASDPTAVRCTGTLIDRRVVLSAAHCGAQNDPSALSVFVGARLSDSSDRIALLDAIAHPAYDGGADSDLALLLLAEPAPAEPAALITRALGDAPAPVRIVGFGVTAPGAGDGDRKREGSSVITEIAARHVVLGADPSLPCHGDSGGPVFVTTAAGEELACVVSRGDAECDAQSRAARVDASLEEFVRPQLAAWAPGSASLLERCLYDEQCESGLCVAASDEPLLRFCTRACATDAECASPSVCSAGLCRFRSPSPGAVGAACDADGDCVRGECLDEGVCSVRCVSGRGECPSGSACTHLGGVDFFCLPEPAPSGCASVAGSRDAGAWPLAAALALLARRGRRRARGRLRSGAGRW